MLLVELSTHGFVIKDSMTAEVYSYRPLSQDLLDAGLRALAFGDLDLHVFVFDCVLDLLPLFVVVEHWEEGELVHILVRLQDEWSCKHERQMQLALQIRDHQLYVLVLLLLLHKVLNVLVLAKNVVMLLLCNQFFQSQRKYSCLGHVQPEVIF